MVVGTLCWQETAIRLTLLKGVGACGQAPRRMRRSSDPNDRFFPEFAEVRQTAYTRRQLHYLGGAPEVGTVSRIDRCLSHAPTPVMLSRQIASWARGTVNDKDMACDHGAVSL